MSSLLHDVVTALRGLRARPGYVVATVLCLALAIGINTTVYSVVDASVLRPLPYAEPDRLVALELTRARDGAVMNDVALPSFVDYRDGTTAFTDAAAYVVRTVNLSDAERPEGMDALYVTPSFFATLGVSPELGRALRSDDARPGAPAVAVVGHRVWLERLGGDPRALGTELEIDGRPHTVVGVMPENWSFTTDIEQLWLPLDADHSTARGSFGYGVLARLAPRATLAQVNAELRTISLRIAERFPESHEGWVASARPLRDAVLPPEMRLALVAMLGAVTFVLLIACANVANLTLGRAAARARELAIRTALGAGRWRLARQVLVESVLLGVAGGAGGVLAAVWGLGAMMAAIPYPLPGWMQVSIDWRVLAYTLGIAVASGILFGLAPALQAGRTDPGSVLRESGRGSSGGKGQSRLRDTLVVAQLALSVVLLAGAALMMKSFVSLQRVDPGFVAAPVLSVELYAGGERFASESRRTAVLADVLERATAIAGVRHAAVVSHAPLSGSNTSSTLSVEGHVMADDQRPNVETRRVAGEYFATLGVALLRGRAPTLAEALDSSSRAVVVNAALAARFWPGRDPIGRRVSIGGTDADRWLTVVGVAPDIRQRDLGRPVGNQLYLPYAGRAGRSMTLLLATGGDPAALVPAVRRAVAAADPTVSVLEAMPMAAVVHRSLWQQRLFGSLFTTFAVAAVFLAAVGLYGVVSNATQQRTREIGVRIAMGARAADIHRLVVGRGARLVALSLSVGLALAWGVTRVLASVLYGVSTSDPLVFLGVAALLGGIAMLASWLPARRAARVDATTALRAE